MDDERLFYASPVVGLPKSGGTPLRHGDNSLHASNVAVDDDFVYSLAAGRVVRSPKSGGAMNERAWWPDTSYTGKGLAVDSVNVYFADGGRVLRSAK